MGRLQDKLRNIGNYFTESVEYEGRRIRRVSYLAYISIMPTVLAAVLGGFVYVANTTISKIKQEAEQYKRFGYSVVLKDPEKVVVSFNSDLANPGDLLNEHYKGKDWMLGGTNAFIFDGKPEFFGTDKNKDGSLDSLVANPGFMEANPKNQFLRARYIEKFPLHPSTGLFRTFAEVYRKGFSEDRRLR